MALFQDAAGLIPALLPGDPVGLITRAAGTVNASQATQASKPTLGRHPRGGRRNLLTWTGDLSNAAWTKIAATAAGDKITESTTDGSHYAHHSFNIPAANYVFRGEFKAEGRKWIRLQIGAPARFAFFNLETGGVANFSAGTTATAVLTGDGWWRCQVSGASEAGFTSAGVYLAPETNVGNYQGDGVSGVRYRNLQVEAGSVATPYQKVTTALNVTEAGVPDVWHLWNDGGDSMPVVLPAGECGIAWVTSIGTVASETVTSDGTTGISLLRADRIADVIIRQGALSAVELQFLTAYWEARYK